MKMADNSFYLDFSRLEKIKSTAKNQHDKAVRQVAEQFESLFLKQIISTMRKASFGGGLGEDSFATDHYKDMYDNQIATLLAKRGGIGLADRLTRQLGSSMRSQGNDNNPARILKQPVLPSQLQLPLRSQAVSGNAINNPFTEQPIANSGKQAANIADSNSEAVTTPLQGFDTDRVFSQSLLKSQQMDSRLQNTKAPQDFVNQLLPHATNAANQLGVDPQVLIAQSALETGWGQKVPSHADGSSSFNLFGIKAGANWQGKTVTITTSEFEQGRFVKKQAVFRAYDNVQQSMQDYVRFIQQNPRYQKALKASSNSAQYLQELQKAGYATDPEYADKIQRIMAGPTMASAINQYGAGKIT